MNDLLDFSILALFLPTFFFVSVTPGMCMTLAMSLGMSVGLKRTFYMMAGELLGVAIVALSSVVGVAAIMINHPIIIYGFTPISRFLKLLCLRILLKFISLKTSTIGFFNTLFIAVSIKLSSPIKKPYVMVFWSMLL